jgi:GT2 family glycosyltransferase
MLTSVIIPVFNAERVLKECLESVISQNYKKNDYEIIIVDNNSKDRSLEIAKSFQNVIVYSQNIRQGCAPTRNRGAKYAKGDILVFFDADQIMDINYLHNILKDINHNEYGAITANVIPMQSKATLVSDYMSREENTMEGKETVDFFGGGSFAMKKAYFEFLGGFDEDLITRQDLDLSFKVIENGKKIKYTKEAFCYHKERPSVSALLKREFYFGVGTYIWGIKNKKKYVNPFSRIVASAVRTVLGVLAILKKTLAFFLTKNTSREIQIIALDIAMHWSKTLGILNGKKYFMAIQNKTFWYK